MELSPRQQLELAKERFGSQDYYGSIHYLQDLIESGKAFADAYHLLGVCYELVDQPERALDAFDRALTLNPNYVEANIHRGIVLAGLGREREAERAFAAAKASGGEDRQGIRAHHASKLANKHADLGEAYAEAGAASRAIGQYRAALELCDDYHDLRYRLARLLLDAGRSLEAREELATVVVARPDMVEARATYGLACYLSGDASMAQGIWKALADAYPKDRRVRAYLSLLERDHDA